MNTLCPPKRVPSAARFFTLCRLTVQLPQSYSVGGQHSSGQLTGKPAGARPDYRGRWCAMKIHGKRRLEAGDVGVLVGKLYANPQPTWAQGFAGRGCLEVQAPENIHCSQSRQPWEHTWKMCGTELSNPTSLMVFIHGDLQYLCCFYENRSSYPRLPSSISEMASQLKEWVAGNKETIETVMEIFEQGAEIVASVVGEFFPIFQIAAPIVKLALDNVESTEAEYMKEQFQKVRDKLDVVSEEITSINNEIKKSGMDQQYFGVEENLTNQFRKFMDILNAKPKFKEVKKKLFLDFFSRTGKEQNLEILYNAVMGAELFTESILNITLVYEEKNRRVMEDFCSRLKKRFLHRLDCVDRSRCPS
ncbi:UNVERIFIED_CONTAM: hypothetical protein FKN15_056740 [Acipenser sinensis]